MLSGARANDPVQYGVVDTGAARGIPGGIGEIYPGTRSWVTFYVETPSIDGSLADVERRGGKVVVPRTVMPDVTLAVFEDPEGHPIGLVERTGAVPAPARTASQAAPVLRGRERRRLGAHRAPARHLLLGSNVDARRLV